MSRIDETFARLRARRETALLPYLTVGFPSPELTARVGAELIQAGADGLELGIPFSDPLADGVTLQRVSQRALDAGVRLEHAFATARALRAGAAVPLIFMSYYNVVQRRGLKVFCEAAVDAGVDGLIVPDLPVEEEGPLEAACNAVELSLVRMVTPTTPEERIAAACARARGFIYCVSVVGVTGARARLSAELPAFVARVRRHTVLPLVVGFGISRPEHVLDVARFADGVIVASALADRLESAGPGGWISAAREYVRELKGACRGARAATAEPKQRS